MALSLKTCAHTQMHQHFQVIANEGCSEPNMKTLNELHISSLYCFNLHHTYLFHYKFNNFQIWALMCLNPKCCIFISLNVNIKKNSNLPHMWTFVLLNKLIINAMLKQMYMYKLLHIHMGV
jgi:hypothetical protein